MASDVTHIIRNDYREYFRKETRKQYAEQTLKTLKEKLWIEDDVSVYVDECFETSFRIYDVEFILRNGFWQIESYYHYVQLLYCIDDYFFLRSMVFDVARTLGQSEAWHAVEYYTWNGGLDEMEKCSLDEWLEYASQTDCGVTEFDPERWIGKSSYENYKSIYHDLFEDCKAQFAHAQKQMPDYELLGLYRTGKHFYRARKNGGLYLVDSRTFSPLNIEPYDGVTQDFNGSEFAVRKGKLSALFDGEGKQLSDFMEGTFSVRWSSSENMFCPKTKKIYNETTGFSILLSD